jgi:solute:Na+ symporter, SSS family
MKLPFFDLAVFLIYMMGVVLYGCSFYFKNQSAEQFTSGGGKLPAWLVGMSIFATFVSSISFLALPGKAYQSNWNALAFSFSIPIAAYMAVKFFIPLYRKQNSISAYAYLEKRFGPWARTYASVCYILTQIMRTGSILYLLALPLNALFDWDVNLIIIITGTAVFIYSMLGGISAVVWTDAIQGFILIIGAVTCAAILTFSLPGGASQLFDIASQHDKFNLGSFGSSLSESTFWVVFIYGLFINMQNYGIDQNYVQRYMTTETEKEAKSSAWFGSMLYIPVSMIFFFIGTALFTYYLTFPTELPESLRHLDAADKVFPYYIVNGLPQGLTGLLIASIFAAGMSTVSTSVNSVATIILSDFYKRYWHTEPSEKRSMRVLYISSLVFGVVGILVALAMTQVKSALDAWWTLASIFSGGMLGLFLMGYFSARVTSRQAAYGVVAGILLICWMSLSPLYWHEGIWLKLSNPFHSHLTIVFGTSIIFIVGFFLSILKSNHQKQPASEEIQIQ